MRPALILVLGSALALGCAEESSKFASAPAARMESNIGNDAPGVLPEGAQRGAAGAPDGTAAKPVVERKIIYTVSLDIAVTKFDGVRQEVERLVKEHPGAFVSEATLSGMKGSRRSGQWTIRVPQDTYEGFTTALRGLGEVRDENKRSEEVTEAFYDLSARLKNKKESEKRLLKIQEERAGELEHVLAAEREIARVREEVERLEGQLNRLENLTSLTTIKLSVSEIQSFQPEELAFTARIGGAWRDSIDGLRHFGQGLAIFLVAITPWLPIWIILGLVVRFVWRRLWPRKKVPPRITVGPPATAV